MSRVEHRLTREVRKHDPKLFVKKNHLGVMQVMRESYQQHPYYVDGSVIYALISAPHFIMGLTHNWTANGTPVEWGIEPIMRRLQAIDGWNENSFVNNELEKHNEKVDLSLKKDMDNKLEAAAYESHSKFKKIFADINTANMNKIDKRRKKGA